MKSARYLLALVFPPASVYLVHGFSTTLAISAFLTFLGWVPGIIHAVWISVKYDEAIGSKNY